MDETESKGIPRRTGGERRPMTSLSRVLEPESVAIVGASRNQGKRGYRVIAALEEWGYEGDVYPVNPKYAGETIRGRRVYDDVTSIPEPVDLAFVVTPASIVPAVIEACGEAGIAGAVVVAAGFGEIDNHGLERELVETAHEAGVRIVGPNSNGLVNTHLGLDLLDRTEMPPGNVALVCQSGNVASSFVHESIHSGIGGFSFYISVGNESDVTFGEYLSFLATHDETDVALVYVEGAAEGREFLQAATEVAPDLPTVVLKGGRSAVGKRSAQSHTASVAGRRRVVDAAYEQAGVVQVERLDEALSVSAALASTPPADGPNVGILSDGGGHATHAADVLVEQGLSVPTFEAETRERLAEAVLEGAPNVSNPVDVLTLEYDLETFADCAEIVLEDPSIDALFVCGYFGGYGDGYSEKLADGERATAERLAELHEESEKPIVVQSMFAHHEGGVLDPIRESSMPLYGSINTATRCVAALATYGEHLQTVADRGDFSPIAADDAADEIVRARENGRRQLSEDEARRVLASYGVPVTPFERAESAAEAVGAATSYDGPVAVKLLSPDVVHKTEADGVRLDLEGEEAVAAAYEEVLENGRAYDPSARIEGVLVSPMVDDGLELIVGATRDEEVGPVVAFGLGGVHVEVLEDVAFRAVPLTETDARELLESVDASPLLEGVRGQLGVDRDALVDVIRSVSRLVAENPSIAELDCNPVIAREKGVDVVDAAITLELEDE